VVYPVKLEHLCALLELLSNQVTPPELFPLAMGVGFG